jgi:hypothetical protein
MRIKKIERGVYIDRDTGRVLSAEEVSPIVEKLRKAGAAGAKKRWGGVKVAPEKKPKEKKIQIKKIGKDKYIDRNTGRELEKKEWLPIVSEQRAYGHMSKNVRIKRSLGTIARMSGESIEEVKKRYVKFVKAYDRYGDQVDWAEYMYR